MPAAITAVMASGFGNSLQPHLWLLRIRREQSAAREQHLAAAQKAASAGNIQGAEKYYVVAQKNDPFSAELLESHALLPE